MLRNNPKTEFTSGRKIRGIIILLILAMTVLLQAGTPVRVMTFNIRYNNPKDGPNAWPNRIEMVASMIRFHKADIVGLQEALLGQLQDLQAQLPEYTWVGVGRDDGAEKGEFTAILYKKDTFELDKHNTFWLSETPDKPSKSWDASLPRIATWGKFQDRRSDSIFFVFNTHFDHRGEIARQESAKLLVGKAYEIAGANAFVVTGDFNAKPDSKPYHNIVAGSQKLVDARDVSLTPPHGPSSTFNGFGPLYLEGRLIDYVFIRPGLEVRSHGTLSETMAGRYPSDHLPVIAEIVIP